ncbi:MAG: NAD(P)-dependent oxidoreductase [Thermoleophilia bacterium]
MARVAFIGLGRMGSGMAGRLLAAGHDIAVFNRTPGRDAALVASGARRAATPREAAEGADAVVVMVADDAASLAVWDGPDGVLAARPAPGGIAVECSTLSHAHVTALAPRAAAAGWRYVDAPVTGLPDAAAQGRLTLLVGAEPADLAGAAWVLEPLAGDVVHFGAVGTGTAYKLIVNLMGAVQIAGVAEALAMAERAGLDLDLVMRTIASGQPASPQVVRNGRRMAAGDHDRDVVFSGLLRRKDTDYGVRLARELGVEPRLGRVALDGLERLIARGSGDRNESAVIDVAREPGA